MEAVLQSGFGTGPKSKLNRMCDDLKSFSTIGGVMDHGWEAWPNLGQRMLFCIPIAASNENKYFTLPVLVMTDLMVRCTGR